MFKMYNEKKLGTWKYDGIYGSYFQPMSLNEFLTKRMLAFGFTDIFWDLQSRNKSLTENLRYKTSAFLNLCPNFKRCSVFETKHYLTPIDC